MNICICIHKYIYIHTYIHTYTYIPCIHVYLACMRRRRWQDGVAKRTEAVADAFEHRAMQVSIRSARRDA